MPILPLLLALAAAPPADCPRALAAVPAAKFCAASAAGVALAETQARADAMIDDAQTGERRFRAAFAAAPARYAVFPYDDPATIAAARAALRGLGYAVALPMPSPAFLAARRERAVAGLPPGARVVTRPAETVGEPRDDRDHIPHELGHLWYAALWPAAAVAGGLRYGSAAPDWLDEAAAMLMEGETRTALYRNRFADGRDPARAEGAPPEIPLATLVTMTHPAMAALSAAGPMAGAIRVTSAPSAFYQEARVFADYLIERSGDPQLLAAITAGLRDGSSFADWLRRDGAGHRLPPSLEALDADWRAWATARYGPPV